MTFADKKVEEFDDKFVFFDDIEKEYFIVGEYEPITNWLKQTIAEAEKEGMKKAYMESCANSGGNLPIEFHKFWDKKLKELEGEK